MSAAERPDGVPVELVGAWTALERGEVGAVVVDVEGGALWPTLTESDRVRELGRRLERAGHLHPSLTPETFGLLRRRAAGQAGPGAPLTAIWERIPTWAHSGLERAAATALDHELLVASAVPDPDVALFLDAVAAARVPVSAVSSGPLTVDQVRRRLELPALDAVTWRSVLTAAERPDDLRALAREAAVPGDGLVLVLTTRAAEDDGALRIVRLGAGARDATALERLADRVATSGEAAAVPGALRDAWVEGARAFGPLLVGFADWAVRHASGRPGAPIVAVAEPGGLLPDLLAELVRARRAAVPVRTLPLTPELVAVAAADGRAVGTALALALAGDGRSPGEVAALLGLPDGHDDLVSLTTALTHDPAARAAADDRARELEAALRTGTDAPPDAPATPLVLCGAGGTGDLQRAVGLALGEAGVPRHVVGLLLATDASAADAVVGPGGGEVLGFAANLGVPADAHAAADAWRSRLEELLGAPDRSRLHLAPAAAGGHEDLRALRVEAARRGVLAFLRHHVREIEAADDPAALGLAGPRLAIRLAALHAGPGLAASRLAADGLRPPEWIDRVVGPLERELVAARTELVRRDAVVRSRAYRFVLRLRALLARVRG